MTTHAKRIALTTVHAQDPVVDTLALCGTQESAAPGCLHARPLPAPTHLTIRAATTLATNISKVSCSRVSVVKNLYKRDYLRLFLNAFVVPLSVERSQPNSNEKIIE